MTTTTQRTPSQDTHDKPVRAGLFATLQEADVVVRKLLAAGFSTEEITVVCSDAHVEQHFQEFEHQKPAGAMAPYAAAAGGAIGAVLGGLAVLAGATLSGGAMLLVAGGLGVWTGGVVGGLVGAMMSRGVDKELANFYDQEVQRGMILVAVEYHRPDQAKRLAEAEWIFTESNAKAIPLAEG